MSFEFENTLTGRTVQIPLDEGVSVTVSRLPEGAAAPQEDRNRRSAQQVLEAAMASKSRALVLVNYASQGMMQVLNGGSFLAEILVTSPQKLFIFIINEYVYRIKVSEIKLI